MRNFLFTVILFLTSSLCLAAESPDSLSSLTFARDVVTPWAILKIFLLLIVVILLIFGAVWLLKRVSPQIPGSASAGLIKILATSYLGPKRSFILVEVLDRIMLVGLTEGDIRLIAEFTDPEEVAQIRSKTGKKTLDGGFAGTLASFIRKNQS